MLNNSILKEILERMQKRYSESRDYGWSAYRSVEELLQVAMETNEKRTKAIKDGMKKSNLKSKKNETTNK